MILEDFNLQGKVALVTGAAQGLGQGLALGLAEAGAEVMVLDIKLGTETIAKIREMGRRADYIEVNLQTLSPGEATQIIARCREQFGSFDILVNNAGIIRRAPALEFSQDDWQSVLDVNLNSVFYLCQAAAQHFVAAEKPGKIINMASMLSFHGGILCPSYTAAKSAIAGITRALANEWAAYNINVNAIAPGYMSTEVTAPIRDDPVRSEMMMTRIPVKRWGTPQDLKGVVVFLASAAATYLHGAIIPVDGGWLAR